MTSALDRQRFAALVDHTLLKPEATADQIDELCDEAIEAGCASVCVNGLWLGHVVARLEGSAVEPCVVAGFPLGAMAPSALVAEIEIAVGQGAAEIDMVIPVGLLASGDVDTLNRYLAGARSAAGSATLKLILETATLDPGEIELGCWLAADHGFDFVKTSTGFSPAGGATVEAVGLMRRVVGDALGVKASGGIRTLADVERMIDAGATRLGMSATLAVLAELEQR